jgi:hypothetical protein
MSTRECFFIRSEGPSSQAVREALRWLLRYPKEKCFLAVIAYGNLRGIISDVIGADNVKVLTRTGRLNLSNKEIVLVTERKPIYDGENSPLVVFYPNRKFLDELDSVRNLSAMLVVPWTMSEVELWIRTRNATELGKPKQVNVPPFVKNKVVEQALNGLTARVNVSTGVSHPRDREAAIQTFQILRNGGEMFTPEEVKAWLIAKGGWRATDAQEVAEIARQVLEGRKLRRGDPSWREDILEMWRKDAEKSA